MAKYAKGYSTAQHYKVTYEDSVILKRDFFIISIKTLDWGEVAKEAEKKLEKMASLGSYIVEIKLLD